MARENIRQLRKLRKLSQAALAKAAGLTASDFSRIECGYRDLSADEAHAIAKALGVAVQEVADKLPAAAAPVAAVVAAAPQPPPLRAPPRTDDLCDPVHFQQLPDFALLERGDLDVEPFRTRLREAVDRATKILHTSKVPAPVWRAWRDFERRVQEVLRTSSTAAPALASIPERSPDNSELVLAAERAFLAARNSKEKHREKSFNALLFEAIRELTSDDALKGLVAEADWRAKQDPSIGFMRHFRNVAVEKLTRTDMQNALQAVQAREAERKTVFRYTPVSTGRN